MTLSVMDPQMAQMTTETALPDSITCGQCAQKYYHVSSFLKHKANCDKLNNNLDKKEASSSSEDSPMKEAPEKPGVFICMACPNSVYPSRDLLRLHLLDAHGVYLPAGVDLSSMLQETKAYQVHPETAKKIAAIRSKKFEEGSNAGSDIHSMSSNDGKEDDSGNDSETKKKLSANDLSVSPSGSAVGHSGTSEPEVDSGNGEMRSPVATGMIDTAPKTPTLPSLPGIPSHMARSILENMVANRLRANMEQSQNNTEKLRSMPNNLPAGLQSLMPFGQGFPNMNNMNNMQNMNNTMNTNMNNINSMVTAQQNALAEAQAAAARERNQDSSQLYQPAVKRRRRGYGSEVGTENLRIERDGEGYCCPLCNYKSRVRSNLTIHLRTHTGYKPYKCPYCPYSSSQSGPLKIHIRGHTGEKPYRCEYCSYASTCRGNLKVHQERHHKEEIIKHGLNAGIRGPNDFDEKSDTEMQPEPSDEEQVDSIHSIEGPVKSEPTQTPGHNHTEHHAMPNQMQFGMGQGFQNRIPPFSFPSFPPTSMAGFPSFLPQPQFPAGFNNNLLAGLFKPKMEQSRPHFPLNMTPPASAFKARLSPVNLPVSEPASITEINETDALELKNDMQS